MKTLRFVLTMGGFLAASQASAMLPPLYTSLNEYKQLLVSPELTGKLGSADWITDIRHDETGFVITTNKNTLKVDIVREQQGVMGPEQFHFVFHDVIPVE